MHRPAGSRFLAERPETAGTELSGSLMQIGDAGSRWADVFLHGVAEATETAVTSSFSVCRCPDNGSRSTHHAADDAFWRSAERCVGTSSPASGVVGLEVTTR